VYRRGFSVAIRRASYPFDSSGRLQGTNPAFSIVFLKGKEEKYEKFFKRRREKNCIRKKIKKSSFYSRKRQQRLRWLAFYPVLLCESIGGSSKKTRDEIEQFFISINRKGDEEKGKKYNRMDSIEH
jgi:hypothetical protein